VTAVPYASLGMYPFPSIVAAWQQLWAVVHDHARWTPADLSWTGDVQADWRTPACVVSQACGWPVAAQLPGVVDVVGAFSLAIPGARGHLYRSVLLAREPDAADRFGHPELVAAANSEDSLSGWISLLAAVGLPQWPGPVRWTGAHRHSLEALTRGEADLACIDALTLEHLSATDPALVQGLHPVGHGPWIPSPAIVVRPGTPDGHRRQLADGLRAAAAEPSIGGPLRFDGFVDLDHHAYQPTLHLVPA
jgi:hypothetical protein